MALPANAPMRFDSYAVNSDGSILLHLTCTAPGAGQSTEYAVTITQAELSGVTTAADLVALVNPKLVTLYRTYTKLDGLLARTWTLP